MHWIGYWWATVRDGAIKRRQLCKVICPSDMPRPEAQTIFDRVLDSTAAPVIVQPGMRATLAEFVERKFLPSLIVRRPKTRAHYEDILKHILPALGKLTLREVTTDQVQELIYEKIRAGWTRTVRDPKRGLIEVRDDFSPQTLRHILKLVKLLFNKAEKIGWFDGRNPAKGVELPEFQPKRRKIALNEEQFRTLIQALRPPTKEMVFLLGMIGMRIGELVGLRWKWVNLTDEMMMVDGEGLPPRTIGIRESFQRVKREDGGPRGRYQDVKEIVSSPRNFALAGPVVAFLTTLKAGAKWNGPDDPVITAKRKRTPVDPHNYLTRHLKPVLHKLGLPDLSWHDLRHTANTWAEQAGASITTRKAMFGWSEDRMAMHYSHASMVEQRIVVEEMARRVLGVTEEKASERKLAG